MVLQAVQVRSKSVPADTTGPAAVQRGNRRSTHWPSGPTASLFATILAMPPSAAKGSTVCAAKRPHKLSASSRKRHKL